MARNLPGMQRSEKKRAAALRIVIFCEGKKTEPDYFDAFAKDHGNGRVEIVYEKAAGVPLTLVRKAVQRKKEIAQKAKKQIVGSSDSVWAVFDRDEHPNVDQARAQARDNDVFVGFSNPCFELWPLLHFADHGACDSRHEVQKKLKQRMPNYDHDDGASIDYEQIKDAYSQARARAERGLKAREDEKEPHGNPSTDVYKLLDMIIENAGKVGAPAEN